MGQCFPEDTGVELLVGLANLIHAASAAACHSLAQSVRAKVIYIESAFADALGYDSLPDLASERAVNDWPSELVLDDTLYEDDLHKLRLQIGDLRLRIDELQYGIQADSGCFYFYRHILR